VNIRSGIRTCYIHLKNLKETKAWYKAVFPFAVEAESDHFLTFRMDGMILCLLQTHHREITPLPYSVFRFETPDVRQAYQECVRKGVRADEPEHFPDGMRGFHIYDPEGNKFLIGEAPHQRGEPACRVVSFEMNSQDPDKAVAFYSSVFGWQAGEANWGYVPFRTGPAEIRGMDGGIAKGPQDFPHGTRIHIEVADIDEAIGRSKQLGAQVVREKMEFDHFYLAYLADPVGIGVGLVQYK